MRKRFLSLLLLGAVALLALGFPQSGEAQRRRVRRGQVCGDPAMSCGEANTFQPYDLQFRIPRNAVIWESEQFYAVMLKSYRAGGNCETHVPESEREAAQALFPRHKVFADRCPEPGTLYYTGANAASRFMAVYAGRTRAEASRVLALVRATGKFPTANLRRLRMGFNGT
ncbi:MAG TPA: hypothetical protein VGC87_14105 [Pyrinomonadaceae bacterium]